MSTLDKFRQLARLCPFYMVTGSELSNTSIREVIEHRAWWAGAKAKSFQRPGTNQFFVLVIDPCGYLVTVSGQLFGSLSQRSLVIQSFIGAVDANVARDYWETTFSGAEFDQFFDHTLPTNSPKLNSDYKDPSEYGRVRVSQTAALSSVKELSRLFPPKEQKRAAKEGLIFFRPSKGLWGKTESGEVATGPLQAEYHEDLGLWLPSSLHELPARVEALVNAAFDETFFRKLEAKKRSLGGSLWCGDTLLSVLLQRPE